VNPKDQTNILQQELLLRRKEVYDHLTSEEYANRFAPPDIRDAVYSYINRGGKSLRPAVALFACGAVGGNEKKALPLAAAIEVYHTWTLIHDDVIDRDARRRGGPTVHEEWHRKALGHGYDDEEARHYGQSIAILAGDVQQAWSMSLLCELYTKEGVLPTLVLNLINHLQTYVMDVLAKGETLDIQYSRIPPEELDEPSILDMLWAKTGVLYEFAGQAGAMVGLNTEDRNHDLVRTIGQFASRCGLAFQLQDDILGIIGDETVLGKPVGSDIREGKRTTIVCDGFRKANKDQKRKLHQILGNRAATDKAIGEAVEILEELGSIKHTSELAKAIADDAISYLDHIRPSDHRRLLIAWARYMIEREF